MLRAYGNILEFFFSFPNALVHASQYWAISFFFFFFPFFFSSLCVVCVCVRVSAWAEGGEAGHLIWQEIWKFAFPSTVIPNPPRAEVWQNFEKKKIIQL